MLKALLVLALSHAHPTWGSRRAARYIVVMSSFQARCYATLGLPYPQGVPHIGMLVTRGRLGKKGSAGFLAWSLQLSTLVGEHETPQRRTTIAVPLESCCVDAGSVGGHVKTDWWMDAGWGGGGGAWHALSSPDQTLPIAIMQYPPPSLLTCSWVVDVIQHNVHACSPIEIMVTVHINKGM